MVDTSDDPRGLIREAYRIEGISPEECRSIFFDWALGSDSPGDLSAANKRLLDKYEAEAREHPMTAVLREGMTTPPTRRRGGRRARAD